LKPVDPVRGAVAPSASLTTRIKTTKRSVGRDNRYGAGSVRLHGRGDGARRDVPGRLLPDRHVRNEQAGARGGGCLGSKPLSLPESPRIAWKQGTFARPIRSAPIGAIAHEQTGCASERPNPRPACHAEGRGFESHHPLLGKPRKRGAFVVLGGNDSGYVATEWQRSYLRGKAPIALPLGA